MKKIAAVFAMPVSMTSYNTMADGRVLNDYCNITLRGQKPEDVWSMRYERIVEAAEELISEIRSVGGVVFTEATLNDVTTAASQSDTLIVFAHWRGHIISASDFKVKVAEVIDAIASSDSECLRSIQAAVKALDHYVKAEKLAEILTDGITDGSVLRQVPDIQKLAGSSKVIAAALSRDLVDEALNVCLKPGNLIELFDGLHPPRQLARSLSLFNGEIDLATCYSNVLATYLSMWRPTGLHLVHAREAIDPLASYTTTQHALRVWHEVGGKYGRARLEVERVLAELL